MTLREYRWEDLETLRKYFGNTQEDIANELHIARTIFSMIPTVSEERKCHYETIVGMFGRSLQFIIYNRIMYQKTLSRVIAMTFCLNMLMI